MDVKWMKDLLAEKTMKDFGIKWTVQDINMKDVDWDASRENIGRMFGLNKEHYEELVQAMKQGSTFPMIVVRIVNGKVILQGGYHRGSSFNELGGKTSPAYVVDIDDTLIQSVFPMVLNRSGGLRASKKEALLKAFKLMDPPHSLSVDDAAKLMFLDRKYVADQKLVYQLRRKLVALKVLGAVDLDPKPGDREKIAYSAAKKLNTISGNDNVLRSVALFVIRSGMKTDDADKFIDEVKQARTEASQIAVVAKYEETWGNVKKAVIPLKQTANKWDIKRKFINQVTSLRSTIDGKETFESLRITNKAEQLETAQAVESLVGSLQTILRNHKGGSHKRKKAN